MKNVHGHTCKKTKVYIYLYISLYENLFENGCIYGPWVIRPFNFQLKIKN